MSRFPRSAYEAEEILGKTNQLKLNLNWWLNYNSYIPPTGSFWISRDDAGHFSNTGGYFSIIDPYIFVPWPYHGRLDDFSQLGQELGVPEWPKLFWNYTLDMRTHTWRRSPNDRNTPYGIRRL